MKLKKEDGPWWEGGRPLACYGILILIFSIGMQNITSCKQFLFIAHVDDQSLLSHRFVTIAESGSEIYLKVKK